MRLPLFILLCSMLACSCSENGEYLDNFDRNALFAKPTQGELEAVKQDWLARDLTPSHYATEQTYQILGNGTVLKFISFHVSGLKEYGALLIPASDKTLPVRMLLGGFSREIKTNVVQLQVDEAFSDKHFILAIPALRGQSLRIILNGTTYESPICEGEHRDAFDEATDDALAFLNVIDSLEPLADVNRVSVRGGSRGGTVALLMGERDDRVKIAIDIAGPTDLITLTDIHENDPTYQYQFLEALVNKTSTMEQVRHKLIASSPIFFAEDLPFTQLHMAENDQIVPLSQGIALKTEIETFEVEPFFQLFIYPGRDHTNIATDNNVLNDRIESVLSSL